MNTFKGPYVKGFPQFTGLKCIAQIFVRENGWQVLNVHVGLSQILKHVFSFLFPPMRSFAC